MTGLFCVLYVIKQNRQCRRISVNLKIFFQDFGATVLNKERFNDFKCQRTDITVKVIRVVIESDKCKCFVLINGVYQSRSQLVCKSK